MIQAVERAAAILHCFETADTLGISEIAAMVKLNKSTAFGLVSTLVDTGFLEQDRETNRYRLGLALFRLGNRVSADLRRFVEQELNILLDTVEETVNYVRPEGGDVIYMVKKESPHSMRICTQIGQRLPMYCTAVGKAILAFMPEETQEKVIRSFDYHPFTENTVAGAAELLRDLAQVRQDGYAMECEELEYGLVCVAAPILDSAGQAVAAVSCSGPKARMTEAKIQLCRDSVLKCAGRLTEVKIGL